MSRGFFGIGIERGKTEANIGTLWRSAYCFGASFIFTIGKRYPNQSTDTVSAWKHIPLYEYRDLDDFQDHIPYSCPLIGVELTDRSKSLEIYRHPESAIYLLGREDGSLSKKAQDICRDLVQFDSKHCLNVATAGSIVMYDRQTKLKSV